MHILAIESSCDETAAAVVKDGRIILSSVIHSQISEHRLYGGVVPEIASRRHVEAVSQVVKAALAQGAMKVDDLDAVGVTVAPGLIGALLVGVNFAKGLAYSNSLPLVPVHHIRGHVASNYLVHPKLKPPFLCLVVSGGHSHIVEVLDYTTFKVVGQTRDDAAGEAFDKVARTLGLPYPGGVAINKAAEDGDNQFYPLPTPKVERYDYSFSGLKTAVVNLVHNLEQKGEAVQASHLAASFQHKVVEILTAKLFGAAQDLGYTTIACAGGVSANTELRAVLKEKCEEKGYSLYVPPLALCGDNAAMIASQAFYEYQKGHTASLDLNAFSGFDISRSFT